MTLATSCTSTDSGLKLWETLKLPKQNPSKPESQAILHAIEELYFFRRYEEAKKVTEEALSGNLTTEFKKTLEEYKAMCEGKIHGVTQEMIQNID